MFTKFGETKCCETFFTKFSENFNPLFGEPFFGDKFFTKFGERNVTKETKLWRFPKKWENFHKIW